MKKIILLLFLFVSIASGAMMLLDNTMYVYKNDGSVDVIFKKDMDSITYSHYDADSVFHVDWQMQVIHSGGYVHKLPFNDIDSVSFIIPEEDRYENTYKISKEHLCGWDEGIVYKDSICIVFKEQTDSTKRCVYINSLLRNNEEGVLVYLDHNGHVTECVTKELLYLVNHDGNEINVCSIDGGSAITHTVSRAIQSRASGASLLDDIAKYVSGYSNIDNVIRGDWTKLIGDVLTDASLKFLLGRSVANGVGIAKSVLDFFNDKSDDKMRFYYGDCRMLISPLCNYTDGVYALKAQITGASTLPKVLPSEIKDWIVNYDIFESTGGVRKSIHSDRITRDVTFDIPLEQLSEGMHTFKAHLLPYEVRGGSCSFFVLGDKPQYTISNVAQKRVNNKVTIDFDFSYTPKSTSDIEMQGVELSEQNYGIKIVTLGINEKSVHVTKTYDTYGLRKGEDGEYIDISIIYYFITSHGSRQTYFVELEPYAIKIDQGLLTCPDNHHPHAIDLGLPSGTKWCCMNVGATSPEGYGGYYAWGETEEKSVYEEWTYSYYSGKNYVLGNCIPVGTDIGSDIAGTPYDVAHVRMGGSWRMPTEGQLREVIDNCIRKWSVLNDVYGILVVGPNGGQVFFPAAGRIAFGELKNMGTICSYWSSSLYPTFENNNARCFEYNYGWSWGVSWHARHFGLSVRAVCP